MKLNHETFSLLFAVGTLEICRGMILEALEACTKERKAMFLSWARDEAVRYRRQVESWYQQTLRLVAS